MTLIKIPKPQLALFIFVVFFTSYFQFINAVFAQSLIPQIQKDYDKGLYLEVIKETTKYIRDFSNTDITEAKFLLGKALFEIKETDSALRHFKDLYINYPLNKFTAGSIFYLGECHQRKGNNQKAKEYYEEIKNNYKESAYYYPALYALSLFNKNTNREAKAVSLLNRVIAHSTDKNLLAKAAIELAKIYYANNNLIKAEKILTGQLTNPLEKSYLELYFLLGEIHLKGKNYQQAVTYYTKSLAPQKKFPFSEDALFGKAFALFCEKEYTEAIIAFEQLKKIYFNGKYTHEIYLLLSEAYFHRENFKKSLKLLLKYKKTIKLSPDLDKVYYFIAENLVALKKYPEAITYYQIIITNYPHSYFYPYSLYGIGWANYKSTNFLEGIEFLKKAAELFSQPELSTKATILRAESFLKKNNFSEAANIYENTIQTQLTDIDKLSSIDRLGFIYYQDHHYLKAINTWRSLFKEINQEDPFYQEVTYKIGWAYLKLGDYPKAINTFESILPFNSAQEFKALIYMSIANTYTLNNDFKKSISAYNKAIKQHPSAEISDRAAYEIGWCYLNFKNADYAQKYFEKYLIQHPTSIYKKDILFWIGEVNYDLKKYSIAETVYRKICELPGQDNLSQQAMFWWGKSFFKQKKFQKSIDIFNQFIEKYYQSDLKLEVTEALGDSFFALKKFKEAKKYYEVITINYPDSYLTTSAQYKIADCNAYLTGKNESLTYYIQLLQNKNLPEELKLSALFKIALAYIEQKDYAYAISYLNNLIYNHNIQFEIWAKGALKLGEIFTSKNDFQNALKTYKQISNLNTPQGYLSRIKIKNMEKKYF